ncbi:MAG: mycofactocin biosynthesis glycosyltransferase MftF [Deltaproteobacteria bacterium]|nr:mycofactocin biosynthesis glycosyltransferase MftF [Deltaproteobacteria bacterium]
MSNYKTPNRGFSNNLQGPNTLAFRLRRGVSYREKRGSAFLILNYPLKVIIIDPRWQPVMKAMSGEEFVLFGDIIPLFKGTGPERIEFFLNDLVRKGFLESRGYSNLHEYPSVSVIIPVRNRPEAISGCLESLRFVDYPEDKLEVLVVDDASTDNTPDVVSAFPVRLIRLEKNRHASFCRNFAARLAGGDILAFLDSDCMADRFWLKEIIPIFNDPATGAAGGLVDSCYDKKGLDRYEKVMSSLNMGCRSRSSREGDLFFYVPSCNLLVRRGVFHELEGFKEDQVVGEDVDLCWRLQDKGHNLEYRPSGRVYHRHRNKLSDFCARRFDYGTSEPILQNAHAARVKNIILPVFAASFWFVVLLSFMTGMISLMVICGFVLLAESVSQLCFVREKNIPVHPADLMVANLRSYISLPYHLCAFFSRYYLLWSLLFVFVLPDISALIFAMHLVTGVAEYVIKRPDLNFPVFFLFFTVDQLCYQSGVWVGCFKRRFFGPVNPRIRQKSFQGGLRWSDQY